MMLKKKKRSVAIVLFILLLCISVFPVFAREEDPGTEMLEIETEMTEVSMEVVNQAYDEAKIKIDSDISWVMME